MTYFERITTNSTICHGKPCITGIRWPVEVILDMLNAGMTIEQVLDDHPELERQDILAAIRYTKSLK